MTGKRHGVSDWCSCSGTRAHDRPKPVTPRDRPPYITGVRPTHRTGSPPGPGRPPGGVSREDDPRPDKGTKE